MSCKIVLLSKLNLGYHKTVSQLVRFNQRSKRNRDNRKKKIFMNTKKHTKEIPIIVLQITTLRKTVNFKRISADFCIAGFCFLHVDTLKCKFGVDEIEGLMSLFTSNTLARKL